MAVPCSRDSDLINEITDSLYLTNAEGAMNTSAIRGKGITCVINATLLFQTPTPTYKDIEFIRVPVDDAPSANLTPYFDKVADKINSVKKSGGRCLLHCLGGRSRSATLVIVYLMKYENMTLKEAHQLVRDRRSLIRPNPGFWKQMILYEEKLKGQNTVKMVSSSIGAIPDVYKEKMGNGAIIWCPRGRVKFEGNISSSQ